jgi:hypothetical protein
VLLLDLSNSIYPLAELGSGVKIGGLVYKDRSFAPTRPMPLLILGAS